MNEIEKSTHVPYRVEMFAPVMKTAGGDYIAVLSDDSLDRDDEMVGKKALTGMGNNFGYVAALLDHENKVMNHVAKWVNPRIVDVDGHNALIAEPKFFMSNPNAAAIKGMLDEGAELGISIGAIVKDFDTVKFMDKSVKSYTDLELVEASFVGIGSNKFARCLAIAKKANITLDKLRTINKREDKKMSDLTYTQKDLDDAKVELTKQLSVKDAEITKLKAELDTVPALKKELEDAKKACDDKTKEKEDEEKKRKAAEDELVETKKLAVEKMKAAGFDEFGKPVAEDLTAIEKSLKDGKIPIARM